MNVDILLHTSIYEPTTRLIMPKKLTTEEFIARAKSVHGDRYVYDNSIYELSTKKLIITCRQHGDFLQTPDSHMHNHGCPSCAIEINSAKRKKASAESMVELTHGVLCNLISYSADTGKFFWISSGSEAGTFNAAGYVIITIMGRSYRAHRLAWFYSYKYWPKNEIDHINNIRCDNRLINLREATHEQNMKNSRLTKANTSGVKGVSWCKMMKKWFAYVGHSGKRIKVGYFNDINIAAKAVMKAREALHNEFHNHGLGENK